MSTDWNRYESAAKRGPWPIFWAGLGTLFAMGLVLYGLSTVCAYTNTVNQVAYEQLNARALLQKYEWFKDAHAALDAKQANIKVSRARMKDMENANGKDRKTWPREDREVYYQWSSETSGVIASYNTLAAEYNSQMAKINYRFTNVGMLPGGATEALPREYAPYNEGGTQ